MKAHGFIARYSTRLLAMALLLIFSACGDDGDGGSPVNDISIKSITPESPAVLKHYQTSATNDRVTIEYDYNITHKEGARIWVRPYTDGDPSPGYLYSRSDIFKGKGSRKVLVSIEEGSGTVNIDQLKVVITNPDQSEYIQERFIDVDYTFEE